MLKRVPSPAYICYESLLEENLKLFESIKKESGAKILLALKGFAMWSSFELVSSYLDGCTASGEYEARLAKKHFGKEVHTYSPAFKEDEIEDIIALSDHIVFNSIGQFEKYSALCKSKKPHISLSLRLNPEVSSAPVDLYNPCGLYSRLGVTLKNLNKKALNRLDGLNFHALCEQDTDALEEVLEAFEAKFAPLIDKVKYVNFGGGHHITKKGYDVQKLIALICDFKKRHPDTEVYLEPGEAVGWEVGVLKATVVDIIHNGMDIAILDVSAEDHMPDTLAMPYKAKVRGAKDAHVLPYTYRLGGNSCLAGDIMGDYSFKEPLNIGDMVIFEDQIHYTFVKSTMFNGLKHPSLIYVAKDGTIKHQRDFSYEDYEKRLS